MLSAKKRWRQKEKNLGNRSTVKLLIYNSKYSFNFSNSVFIEARSIDRIRSKSHLSVPRALREVLQQNLQNFMMKFSQIMITMSICQEQKISIPMA